MFNESWPVLIVDDEPDVLQLSKLIMQDFTVYGLPLKLYTAESKAQALDLIHKELIPALSTITPPNVAVAFIDVVMESDTAGLELCQYIRETMGNKTAQLFIRTGQPGVAPEREVIDRYDINGYFTKAEATEDKLYSLVKSGVRQYVSFTAAMLASKASTLFARASGAPTSVIKTLIGAAPMLQREGHGLLVDGEFVAGTLGEAETKEIVAGLSKMPGESMVGGGKFVSDGQGTMLFEATGDGMQATVYHVVKGDWNFTPPDAVQSILHSMWSSLGIIWKKAH
jgi:CheY-like chemotaxis protein